MSSFGALAVGLPGSGKSTWCGIMADSMAQMGRPCAVVNLDPANEWAAADGAPYGGHMFVDVRQLVCVEEVMRSEGLGPNGAMLFCIEYMCTNVDWIVSKIRALGTQPGENVRPYLLLDFPGQVEIFTHCDSVMRLLHQLQCELDLRLVAVHLVDAHHCINAPSFISTTVLSLMMMVRLELPFINALSKVDMLERVEDELPFNFEFFTEELEMARLLPYIDSAPSKTLDPADAAAATEEEISAQGVSGERDAEPLEPSVNLQSQRRKRRLRLHSRLCELVEDHGLVAYEPFNISERETVVLLIKNMDKANGYLYNASS